MKNLVLLCVLLGFSVAAIPADRKDHINLVEFKDVDVKDAARILANMSGSNIIVTQEARGKRVDLLLKDVTLKHAVEMVARVSGLWYRQNRQNNSFLIMTQQQYQDDIEVYRDDIIRSFILKHQNVKATALTIQSLFGDRVILKMQDDLDDFEGIPGDYLQTIDDHFSENQSGSGSGSSRNGSSTSRRSSNQSNRRSNSGNGSSGSNGSSGEPNDFNQFSARNTGEIDVRDREEIVNDIIQNDQTLQNLDPASLRRIQGLDSIDADTVGKKIGIKTPIFIATNRIHNLLFVRTSDEQALMDIEELIETSDKPTPQVLLETKIVRIEIGDEYTQDIDFDFNDGLNVDNANYEDGTSITDALSGNAAIEVDDMSVSNVARIASQLTGKSVTGLGFNGVTGGFYEFYSEYINARLQLMQQLNQAEIIAKPILMASNNRPARLFIGEDQVIATGIDSGTTTVVSSGNSSNTVSDDTQLETEVRKIGSTIALLPSVNDDRTVTIDILQSTSDLVEGGMNFPFFNPETGTIGTVALDTVEESTLKTIFVAKDGHTIAIGGMNNDVDSKRNTTVPFLGEIPILGELFNTRNETESSFQYVILITPHIVESPEEGNAKSREIDDIDYEKYADNSTLTQPGGAESDGKTRYETRDLVYLNRYAAYATRGKPLNDQSVKAVAVPQVPLSSLIKSDAIQSWAVSGYRQNNLYVTAVKVRNMSDEALAIDTRNLPGHWLSVSREQPYLAPFRQEQNGLTDTSYLYFVSQRPFGRIVDELPGD